MNDPLAREPKPRLGSPDTPILDLFKLEGRTILITGGGGAMGLEVARSVLETGGDVICIDRQTDPLPEPWEKVKGVAEKYNTKAWYYQVDVSNIDHVNAVIQKALSTVRFPLRGLVTCAGISGGGPTAEFPIAELKRIYDINVTGTYACAQAAAREFQKQGVAGSIVLIASMSGHVYNKGVDTSAYNSSKAAVIQLARSLADEWGSRVGSPLIRVNSVSPGYIKTRMTVDSLQDERISKLWREDNMMMRLSEADEYRGPIMFLLSDASSFVTGADLRVDGGHTAW